LRARPAPPAPAQQVTFSQYEVTWGRVMPVGHDQLQCAIVILAFVAYANA
jgi:hypothetical protein